VKLMRAVELYIQRKRETGLRFRSSATVLRSFLGHCGNSELRRITLAQVTTFIEGSGVRPGTWCGKHGTLRRFLEYWMLRGQLKRCPVPPHAPKVPQAFVPYIYSRRELRQLLNNHNVQQCQRVSACVVSAATLRTLLFFLYGTGMRVSEALRLLLSDVDMDRGVVTIRGTKFYKSRLVPLGPDVQKAVEKYLQSPGRRNQHYQSLLQSKNCKPIDLQVVDASFVRLRELAGVVRDEKSTYQPRVHDLRHTTATHLLRSGVDINTIRAWLGHVSIDTTNIYAESDLAMKATALAMCEAPSRQNGKRWRDNPDLLAFLAQL
jgi:integrase/recombinase XerD